MPEFVKTAADEEAWARAKAAVTKQYPDKDAESDGFYALVTALYKKMGGKTSADRKEWVEIAAKLNPIREEKIGVRVAPDQIKVGDRVAVTSRLGRTLASGVVSQALQNGTIAVQVDAFGITQTIALDAKLNLFYRDSAEESDNLGEAPQMTIAPVVNIGSTVASNPYDSPNSGPLPVVPDEPVGAVKVVLDFVAGDLYWASQVLSDIKSFGFWRAMKRHQIEDADLLYGLLVAGKHIDPEPDTNTPEWAIS